MKKRVLACLIAAVILIATGCATAAGGVTPTDRDTQGEDSATASPVGFEETEPASEPGTEPITESYTEPVAEPETDDTPITRYSFIYRLAQADGIDLSASSSWRSMYHPYSDVDAGDAAMCWAYRTWITDESESFRRNDPVTYEEAVRFLANYLTYRYTALSEVVTALPKNAQLSDEGREAAEKCLKYGVIDRAEAETRAPASPVTTAEAAAWIDRAMHAESSLHFDGKAGFASSLIGAIAPEGNYMVSPYSARMCLSMLANGAEGETLQQLLDALQSESLDALNAEYSTLFSRYDAVRDLSLETANAAFLNQSAFRGHAAFLSTFRQVLGDIYRADTEVVTNANSVERANEWVNEKTHEKIPSILDEDAREYAVALINAVYFKAGWAAPFYESQTKPGIFHGENGVASEVDFLNKTDIIGYYSTSGTEAVKLDYSSPNADISMYLILSDEEAFDYDAFFAQAEFRYSLVRLSMPKFKFEYSASLNDALRALGVTRAYEKTRAELTAMVAPESLDGENLYLSTVHQKTYISVDENGTEAAAVTAIIVDATTAEPSRPPMLRTFIADSPFTFVIRDNRSGTLLFVGRYACAE